MHKNMDVGRRILGVLLAVCMVVGLIPPIPAKAADSEYTVRLWTDESRSTLVDDTTYSYTGESVTPYVEVIDSTGTSLSSGNYQVQYANNINAGEATVTIAGNGSYDFSLTTTFDINPAYLNDVKLTYEDAESGVPYCYYSSAGSKPKIITVKGELASTATYVDLTEGVDYTISYANNTEACKDLANASCPYLTIALKGNYSYVPGAPAKQVRYRIYYDMSKVTVSDIADKTYNGTAHTPAYTLTNTEKSGETVTCEAVWENNTNAGTATLRLTGTGKYKGTLTKTFVIGAADISAATITFDKESYDYTGSVIAMDSHITVKLGEYVVPASNYSIIYNTEGIMGNNTLTLKGKNNLTGEKFGQYKIVDWLGDCSLNMSEFVFDGTKKVPTLTVTDVLGNLLDTTKYNVSYYSAPTTVGEDPYEADKKVEEPIQVGKYYVKVEGKNFVQGTLGTVDNPLTFSIVPKQISAATYLIDGNYVASDSSYTVYYDGTSKLSTMQKVTVIDGKTLEKDVDYVLGFYKNEACTEEITDASECVNAGTYYVKVTGLDSYEASTYRLSFTIAPKQVTPTLTVVAQDYTGNPIVPAKTDITVTAEGVAGEIEDYTITCTNNVNIGIANISIHLTGNLIGYGSATFQILPRKISDCTIYPEEAVIKSTYNGEIQRPVIEVWDGARKLVENTDYKVTCYNNIACKPTDECTGQKAVGSCYVVITGLGTYANSAGTVKKTFTVTPKALTDSTVTFVAADKDYTENVVEPEFQVKDGSTVLVAGTDYEVVGYYKDEECTVGSDMISGRVFIKIKGKGNYDSEVTRVADFYIGNDISVIAETMSVTTSLTYNRSSLYDKILDNLVVYDGAGEIIPESKYLVHFYSDRNYTREITSGDNALFINAGTIYIGIEGRNGYYGMFNGAVSIMPKSISTLEGRVGGTHVYTGSDIRLEINDGTDLTETTGIFLIYPDVAAGGGDYTLTSSEYKISQYSNNKNAGTATVTLTGTGNYTGTQTVLFNIQKKSLNDLSNLSVKIPSTIYTSRKQMPSVVVTQGDDSTALVNETDFVLEYFMDESYTVRATDVDLTDAGTVYVKITGIGNYKDELSTEKLKGTNQYVIAPRDIREVVVSLEGGSYVYSDVPTSSKIPEFTVKFQYATGSYYTLEWGTDYTYTPDTMGYSIGEQTLDIKAVSGGNFTGDKAVNFFYRGNMKNSADEIRVEGIDESVAYTSSIGQNGATFSNIVVYSKSSGQEINKSCYSIEYVSNRTVGTATVNITGKENLYWTGTYTKTFKITGSVTEAEVTIPDQVYTGTAYTGDTLKDMQITCHGYTLVKDTDYTVEAVDNGLNAAIGESGGASAPTITIRGKGDFFPNNTETLKVNFNIKYDLNGENMSIAEIPDQVYTGSAVEPIIALQYNKPDGSKATLTRDVDYTVEYYNNTEVGSANGARGPYAVITAKEDGLLLSGTRIVPFSIGMVDLENDAKDYRITGVAPEYCYTGAAIRPEVKVEDVDGNVLDPKNYTVVCESSTWEASTVVTIQVIGKGNYYGTITKSFNIVPRSLGNAEGQVEAKISDVIYNGQEQKPTFTVTFEDYNLDSEGKGKTQTLKEGIDYIVVGYFNNVDEGTAGSEYNYESGPYVKIQAIPGRSIVGERIIPFTIEARDMTTLCYSKVENPVYETSKTAYEPEVTIKISAGDEKVLTPGIDYTISYYNNTQVAVANEQVGPYIEIEAYSHNFTGTYVIPFSILPRDITGEEFEVTLQELNGAQFDEKKWNYPEPGTYTPQVILTDCTDPENPVDLTELTDYQLTYANNDAVGTATITIEAKGNYAGTRTERFTIGTLFDTSNVSVYQNNSQVTDSFAEVTYNGTCQVPANVAVKRIIEPVAELELDVDYQIIYYTDELCTKPILAENVIHAGTYYMKLEGLTTAGYIGEIVIPFVIRQKNVNSADVIVKEIEPQRFAGGNVQPGITLYDTSVLTEDGEPMEIPTSAYDVTYYDNNSIGTATAVITANEKGNYVGSREIPFNIIRQDISGATVYPIPDYDYTGEAILPEPVIYFDGTRLEKDKDYVLENNPNYGNNTKAGEAWLVIQGIGNYTGVKKAAFRIKANLETATVSPVANQIYTGEAVKPALKVVCGGNVLTAGVEYQIDYNNNTAPGDAYMVILPTDAYSDLYTGSYVVRFSICDSIESATVTGIPTSQTYTGDKITPEPEVKIGNTLLKKDKDYTVQWNNAVNVGTATVVINGIGKYAGSKRVTYSIIAKSISRCIVSPIADINYDGKTHSPSVVIGDGSKVLALGTDYSIDSYTNNKDIGTAVITVRGIGNYSGTMKVKFSIISAPITGLKYGSVTKDSVKISWSKKPHVTGYEIYTSNGRTCIARTTKTSVKLKKLKSGSTYTYKVRTYTVIDNKTYYGEFKTVKFATKPARPVITVKSKKSRQVQITWKKVTGAKGYEVYAATSKKAKYKKVAIILKGATVKCSLKKLKSKKTYYYKVRAYRTVNGKKIYSSYSRVESVVVK